MIFAVSQPVPMEQANAQPGVGQTAATNGLAQLQQHFGGPAVTATLAQQPPALPQAAPAAVIAAVARQPPALPPAASAAVTAAVARQPPALPPAAPPAVPVNSNLAGALARFDIEAGLVAPLVAMFIPASLV